MHVIINHTQKNPVAEELLPNPSLGFCEAFEVIGLSVLCIVSVLKGIKPFLWLGFVKGEFVE